MLLRVSFNKGHKIFLLVKREFHYTYGIEVLVDVARDIYFDIYENTQNSISSIISHEFSLIKRRAPDFFENFINQRGLLYVVLAHGSSGSEKFSIWDDREKIFLEDYLSSNLKDVNCDRCLFYGCNYNVCDLEGEFGVDVAYIKGGVGEAVSFNSGDFRIKRAKSKKLHLV